MNLLKTLVLALTILVPLRNASALDFTKPVVDCRSLNGRFMVQIGTLGGQLFLRSYEWTKLDHPGHGEVAFPTPLSDLLPVIVDGFDDGVDGVTVYYGGEHPGDPWEAPWDRSDVSLEISLQTGMEKELQATFRHTTELETSEFWQMQCNLDGEFKL